MPAVYELLRYGLKVTPDFGQNTETVSPIDWKRPEKNQLALIDKPPAGAEYRLEQHRQLRSSEGVCGRRGSADRIDPKRRRE